MTLSFSSMALSKITTLDIFLILLICGLFFSQSAVLPDYLIAILLVFYVSEDLFHRQPKSSVSASPSVDGALVEIGGLHHQQDWTRQLQASCAKALRNHVSYVCRPFKLHLRMHLCADAALDNFRELLEILALHYSPGSTKGTPPLELNVEILRNKLAVTDDAIDRMEVNIDRLASLQKLTWTGPFAHFLFTRPLFRSSPWDAVFSTGPEIKFGRLTELRLLDCVLDPDDLIDILSNCPLLASCEVEHLGALGEVSTGILHHMHLRHLRISSTVGLARFFKDIVLHSLEALSLRLAPSAFENDHDDVSRLAIPWISLREVEVWAPLDCGSMASLKRFFDREPSHWGRAHVLVDDREEWYRQRP
ncbi:hypothetical protein BDZ97DRAFT_1913524 [Flammula alnicola]|nr:hypothetical protein BDZ97DRAFT_1913524 [Flammula alnicola]